MPRLDNSNRVNLLVLREWGDPVRWKDDFDPTDPGKMPPMDVCRNCIADDEFELMGDVEHPSYADGYYECAICMKVLDEDDD